jgi:hypothetical protein
MPLEIATSSTIQETAMRIRPSSFRLLGISIFVALLLLADLPLRHAPGAPAPKPNPPYALLYIPKKAGQYETTRYRRRQFAFFKENSSPFVLFRAIRNLKNTNLPSLPKKGKGGEGKHDNDEDTAWLGQNLKVEYLDGTGVLRITLAAGSRREQALLVNAVVHAYFQLEVDRQKQSCELDLESAKRQIKMWREVFKTADGAEKKNLEQGIVVLKVQIKLCEDALRTLPRLLEFADGPPE